jgi:HAMP domain-containing protein
MKIQHKSSLLIFGIGILFLITISAIYYYKSSSFAVTNTQRASQIFVDQFAHHVEEQLMKDAQVTFTLANAPVITESLTMSNSIFARLNQDEREQEIARLNKKWMEIKDVENPFIQAYMTNSVASYLKNQQDMFPDFFGEIFLTNRYGVIVATTKKLTTLAHAHKYWWFGSYYEGRGRTFFDDRGYDESVQGYVVGVVVPVKKGDEIIGILKCNIKILGPFSDIFDEFTENRPGTMRLVRSKGLIVFEKEKEPLSGKVSIPLLLEEMANWTSNSLIATMNGTKQIISFAPVTITRGSDQYGFGGSHDSVDHIKGNLGEGWFVVFSRELYDTILTSERFTQGIILIGFILILFMALSALLFGRNIAAPIIKLVKMTKKVGKGDFNAQFEFASKDELGTLANAFNTMVTNLRETTTSRDKLIEEINQRKKAEEEEEVKTLKGILASLLCLWINS